jgi:FKBP-type peptidyl-prolyl cis-trans isomerase
MKCLVSVLLAMVLFAGTVSAEEKLTTLSSEQEKLSYAMGIDLGKYLTGLNEEIQIKALVQGVSDAYAGGELLMSEEEAKQVQQAFAQRQKEKQMKEAVETLQKNQTAGDTFLAENKTKEGVVETESGLQYKVIKQGEGAQPTSSDTVRVHYQGTLLDGTEFDSSYKRESPVEFPVNQVIQGWQEALPLMKVGSTYELYIPAALAYGDRGAPPYIEPGSTLLFKVELLDIVKPEAAPEEPAAAEGQPAQEGAGEKTE